MMILLKLSKFVKNKDIFQIIITLIFLFIVFLLEFKIGTNVIDKIDNNLNIQSEQVVNAFSEFNKKLENINKYFLEINPIIDILNNYNKLISIFYLLKIILINLIFFILFIFIGNKYYLKNILKNKNYLFGKRFKKKKYKKIIYIKRY